MVRINERQPGEIGSKDPRFARLPLWAQGEITRLERSVAWWQVQATAGPDESDTFVQRVELEQPLGRRAEIAFQLGGEKGRILAQLVDAETVEIAASSSSIATGLRILPRSGNCVRVQIAE
jgi:hypothetical protein